MPYLPSGATSPPVNSTLSLHSTLERIYEPPSVIQRKLTDRFYKKPYEKCCAAAVIEKSKADKMLDESAKGITVLGNEDVKRLRDGITQVELRKQGYQNARDNLKDPVKCGTACVNLEQSILRLHGARTNSRALSVYQKEVNSDYKCISTKKKVEMIFTSPNNPKFDWERWPCLDPLKRLLTWFCKGHVTHRVHWLQGPARCGKTTILRHLTDDYILPFEDGLLASITFDQSLSHQSFTSHFLPTILDQLASRHAAFKTNLASLCRLRDDDYFATTAMQKQIQELFIQPLEELVPPGSTPLVIILDGLDRCGDSVLHLLWSFMKQTLFSSALPIFFLLTASDAPRISKGLLSAELSGTVDVNQVEDYRSTRRRIIEEFEKAQAEANPPPPTVPEGDDGTGEGTQAAPPPEPATAVSEGVAEGQS